MKIGKETGDKSLHIMKIESDCEKESLLMMRGLFF